MKVKKVNKKSQITLNYSIGILLFLIFVVSLSIYFYGDGVDFFKDAIGID
jgi:uncharacterized protein (UPF0333 family)